MAQVIADRRDIDFVLYEQLKIDELTKLDRYRDFNKKIFDMIITEAQKYWRQRIAADLRRRRPGRAGF